MNQTIGGATTNAEISGVDLQALRALKHLLFTQERIEIEHACNPNPNPSQERLCILTLPGYGVLCLTQSLNEVVAEFARSPHAFEFSPIQRHVSALWQNETELRDTEL